MCNTNLKDEKGFTLVELSIVLIIIGLLIAGVLQGQELINNTRLTTTASQLTNYDAAFTAFEDIYGDLPATMSNPGVRIPNCTGACAVPGGTNETIGVAPGTGIATMAAAGDAGEGARVWSQLQAAGYISGLPSNIPTANPPQAGSEVVATKLTNSALLVGFAAPGQQPLVMTQGSTIAPSGHYMYVMNNAAANITNGAGTNGGPFTPVQAGAIDAKMDDGQPNLGRLLGQGGNAGAATDCTNVATPQAIYQGSNTNPVCGMYYRTNF